MESVLRARVLAMAAMLGAAAGARADFIADAAAMRKVQPEGYVCLRAAEPVQIDGKLDDAAWQRTAWTRDFQDIEGPSKPAPRFKTRAKMLWDENYFYIAAELEEPHVWATLTNHDAVIFRDPDFEVFIDPDGDRHNYYEFEMNALNTTWDLLLKKPYIDGGPALNEWEIPGAKTAVHINGTLNLSSDRDQSWTVEIAFPWKALAQYSKQAAPPKRGDVWRVDFSRVEWQIDTNDGTYRKLPNTKEDNWVWSPTGIIDMHRPEQWGYVLFAEMLPKEAFRPARDSRIDSVMNGYYREHEFKARYGHWAKTLGELNGLGSMEFTGAPIRFSSTAGGFSISSDHIAGSSKHLPAVHVREDGLLWRDPR